MLNAEEIVWMALSHFVISVSRSCHLTVKILSHISIWDLFCPNYLLHSFSETHLC